MTWNDYQKRCEKLAGRFRACGQLVRALYWLNDALICLTWPRAHMMAEIRYAVIIQELEQDEKLCDLMEAGEMELCQA